MNKASLKFRLRTTLIIPFVIQILAAVGLVGYISFRNGQESVQRIARQLRTEVAARTVGVMEDYFRLPHEITRLNINALRLKQINLKDREALEQSFFYQMKTFPLCREILMGTINQEIVMAGHESDGDFISNTMNVYPIREMYELDSQGRRKKLIKSVVSPNPLPPSVYQRARDNRGQSWSDFYVFKTFQNMGIGAIEAEHDEKGNLIAFFVSKVSVGEITDFLKTLKVSPTGQVFLLDRTGLLVATSTGESSTVDVNGEKKMFKAIDSKNSLTSQTAKYLQPYVKNLSDPKSKETLTQELSFDIDGQRQNVLVRRYLDGKGLDLSVVVVIPEADFMEQINANTRNTVLLCSGALGVSISLGILTSRWITRPLLRISQASEELAAGNLDGRVDIDNGLEINEIQTLERSFNSMAGQLQESFETLEDKVKERTADLATANESIIALNERLKGENLRMGAELDVARQIQMMILPKPEELENIEGLDIAGYMEPADEVGGDYYDVLHTDGVVTLGIGDVTGHGLESGILMLMTQTAVRTLQEIRETDPVVFLDTLNRTLYKNVQRMNSEKSLTLAIVNYADGKISISGQHEEAIIVRKGGQIERIDTMDLGFPIGLDGDITEFISHAIFDLAIGDGIVLYTDGIPEAKDINKVQYQVERLCEVISENWHKSASEIKDDIITDLRRHIGTQKIFDDITLLVLKRQE